MGEARIRKELGSTQGRPTKRISLRRILWMLLASLLIALVIAGVMDAQRSSESKAAFGRVDRAMVGKVDIALADALSSDAELTQRLGKFVRLEGTDYSRSHGPWQLIPYMYMERQAVFEKGSVTLNVTISTGESREVSNLGRISWSPAIRMGEEDLEILDVTVGGNHAPLSMAFTALCLSADTGTVFLARENEVEIWDRETAHRVSNIKGRFLQPHRLVQAASSGRLVIEADNRLFAVDPETGRFAASFRISRIGMTGPRTGISADGRVMLYRPHDGLPTEIHLIRKLGADDSTTLKLKPPFKSSSIFLAPDARHTLLVNEDSTEAQCWDLETATPVWTKPYPEKYRTIIALFTPLTGRLCVHRDNCDGAPEIWNPSSGEAGLALQTPPENIWGQFRGDDEDKSKMIAISPDEQLLALASYNGRVMVWQLPSGRFAGLIDNKDWEDGGTLSNESKRQWLDPMPWPGNCNPLPRGMHLTAVGFDRDNRLIGIVLCPDMAWVWKAQTAKLLQKSMNAPK